MTDIRKIDYEFGKVIPDDQYAVLIRSLCINCHKDTNKHFLLKTIFRSKYDWPIQDYTNAISICSEECKMLFLFSRGYV